MENIKGFIEVNYTVNSAIDKRNSSVSKVLLININRIAEVWIHCNHAVISIMKEGGVIEHVKVNESYFEIKQRIKNAL